MLGPWNSMKMPDYDAWLLAIFKNADVNNDADGLKGNCCAVIKICNMTVWPKKRRRRGRRKKKEPNNLCLTSNLFRSLPFVSFSHSVNASHLEILITLKQPGEQTKDSNLISTRSHSNPTSRGQVKYTHTQLHTHIVITNTCLRRRQDRVDYPLHYSFKIVTDNTCLNIIRWPKINPWVN